MDGVPVARPRKHSKRSLAEAVNPPLGEEQRSVLTRDQCRILDDARVAAGGERGYRWPSGGEGNTHNMTHGAGDGIITHTPPKALAERMDQIEKATLDYLDGACPAQLLMPQFTAAVKSWARREARALLLSEWLDGMTVEEMTSQQRPNAMKVPFELWLAAEHSAAKARKDLGLDPVSWASIQKDLGIAGRAADDAISRLGAAGARITEERELRMIEGGGGGSTA